jgi:hypothetical protein
MTSWVMRTLASVALGVLAVLLLAAASAPARNPAKAQTDKVVIVTTTDVKGKTSPCG